MFFRLPGMIRKQGAAIILLLELELLHHGSHGSIQDENPLVERLNDIERGGFLELAWHRNGAKNGSTWEGALQMID